MDQETIQKIATEVAKHLPSYSWALLLLQVVLTLGAAWAGAFFGEYFKTRGKNLATKADFESLKVQLSANTKLVETIKAEVGQKDWAQRERINLRRIKLEALVQKMHECRAYLDLHRASTGQIVTVPDPVGEMGTLADLYLPELKAQAAAFSVAYLRQKLSDIGLKGELLDAGSDLEGNRRAREKYQNKYAAEYADLTRASTELTTAARELLVKITDASEQQ
jgi:hypothetical protein